MKIDAPWSTKIIDQLPLQEREILLLRLWIWSDRFMWVSFTIAIFSFAVVYFK